MTLPDFSFFLPLVLPNVRNVAAIWSTEHALAWHLEEAFRKDSAAWAAAKCQQWDRKEADLPGFLEEIPDCPCTLAQARADSGRFHVSAPVPGEAPLAAGVVPGRPRRRRLATLLTSPGKGRLRRCL